MGYTTKEIPFRERSAELMRRALKVTSMSHDLSSDHPSTWLADNIAEVMFCIKQSENTKLEISDDNRAFISFGENFIECEFLKPQISPTRRLFGVSHVKHHTKD